MIEAQGEQRLTSSLLGQVSMPRPPSTLSWPGPQSRKSLPGQVQLVAQRPPRYVRPPVVSRFIVYEPRVRELLENFPAMPAPVIAERVGWDGSPSWFRKQVAGLRIDNAPRDPADRLEYRHGDQA